MDIISSKSIKSISNLPFSIEHKRKIRESNESIKIISNNVIFNDESENLIIKSQSILIQSNFTTKTYLNESESTTINYDDYGIGHEPSLSDITTSCEQYFSMGKFIPHESLEFLSKLIFQVESFEKVIFC